MQSDLVPNNFTTRQVLKLEMLHERLFLTPIFKVFRTGAQIASHVSVTFSTIRQEAANLGISLGGLLANAYFSAAAQESAK